MHLDRAGFPFQVAIASFVVFFLLSFSSVLHAQTAPGGFVEQATSTSSRPLISASAARAFLPARGPFTFPAPYNTTGVRLTTGADCGGGDCVNSVGYSYWNNINNHAGSDTLLVFLGLERSSGGAGPSLFSVNKRTGQTRNLGPLFPSNSRFSWASGEGWYFSGTRPHALYMNDGPRLLRYDVQARSFETVFDVTSRFGANRYIWQVHSSHDDRVHSATLRDSTTYAELGCVVYKEDARQWYFAARRGDFDECQIDKSGRWLVIKENVDARNGEDNRIIDLQTGTERVLLDENGAGGHSDLGFGYMVAADNWNGSPAAVRLWRFDMDVRGGQPHASVGGQGTTVSRQTSWQGSVGHIAHGNAHPGVPMERQIACSSSAHRQALPRVNEIVCYRLDGSLQTLVVAPNLTNLDTAGGGTTEYFKLPKGNLDPTGEYFIWTANAGTSRLDAFLVRVPTALLTGVAAPGTGSAAPGRPTIGGSLSGNRVTARWAAGAGAPPSAYVLSVGTTPGGTDVFHHNMGLTTEASGSLPDGRYYIRVTAMNGSGAASADASFTVGAGVRVPAAPAVSVRVSGRRVSATWAAGDGAPPASYVVSVGTSPGAANLYSANVGLITSGAADLPPGTYYLRITAVNSVGAASTDRTFRVR